MIFKVSFQKFLSYSHLFSTNKLLILASDIFINAHNNHCIQMLFSRFLKFVKSVAMNKRVEVRVLYNICKDDIRSMTGSNIRTVLLQTEVDPRLLQVHLLRDWRVYRSADNWTVSLLQNLMRIRGEEWEVHFDDETSWASQDDDVEHMIQAICNG